GLDYSTSHYNNNPSYIPDAEKLGMTTNVYTIDTQASIINVTNMNIDFVTTNYPDIAKRIYRLYDINKPEGYNTMRQLRSYIIECEGDTTNYNNGKYIQSSVDSYNKTLEAARNAVLLQNTSEQEYSTLLQALKLAHRNLLPKPIADALDVKFNADATATDFSSLANNIEIVGTPSVYQHPAFNANVAILNGSFGSAPTDFFKIDYNTSRTNGKLKDALQNGHSLELIFRLRSEVPSTAVSHLFSGNRSGASALFMSGPQIAFSVNSSIGGNTSSQHIVTSGIQAKVDTFYHAIGVWDAKNQTETIYINGKKCAEQSAVGLLHYPIITSAQWYCIGGSPYSSSVSENGGNYEIESAKIYSSALTVDQVQYLWDMVHQNIDEANTLYTGTKTIKTCHNENLYGFQVSGVKTTQSANIDGINIVNSRKFFNH
ncbi:MAG: hypothetical protein KBT27_04210, partial [Prevotellaceae bacterium]|nr:hypothetical protein [Candidatus Faecinaster equi]